MAIGFAIAAPVGPMGVLCIRRTLQSGHVQGLATGLGAATVHAVLAATALLGFNRLAVLASGQVVWLGVGGRWFCACRGCAACALGLSSRAVVW